MTEFLNFKFRPNGATANGKVFTYKAGTYETKSTYPTKDDATNETNANANPVILDARGEGDVWVKGATKVVLKDSNDNILWTADDFDSSTDNVLDANGNEILDLESVVGAVNNVNISNAATGNSPIIEGVGGDTNIGVGLAAKGTGKVAIPTGDLTITSGDTTLLSGDVNLTVGDVILTSGDLTITSGSIIISDTTTSFDALPVGLVMWNGSASVPDGWLECDGSAVSRTTYSALFALIGTTYGAGNGTTTFNLPDQARNILVGKGGSGTGTLGNSIGDTGGAETHALTTSEMPAHTHTIDTIDQTVRAEDDDVVASEKIFAGTFETHLGTPNTTSASAGSGTAHNIMQPSLVAMMIIRAY